MNTPAQPILRGLRDLRETLERGENPGLLGPVSTLGRCPHCRPGIQNRNILCALCHGTGWVRQGPAKEKGIQ